MSLLEHSQDMARTLHAVDVLAAVRTRLEAVGDEAALESLHHFHRLCADELAILVALEVGVLTVSDLRKQGLPLDPGDDVPPSAAIAA